MKHRLLLSSVGVLLGAGLGWLYWYYFGCTNSCSITSSPVKSSVYGAVTCGLFLGSISRAERSTDVSDTAS